MRNSRSAGTVLVVLASVWMGAACLASGVDTTDPSLPPNTGDYVGSIMSYHGPGLTVFLQDPHLHALAATATRTPSGADEVELFNATLSAQVSVNGSPSQPSSGSGQEQTLTHNKIGNTTGTFQTEMLMLNLSGVSPFGPYQLRESPTLVSPGQTTITDIGGGLYHIDSFFDVFTELSVDGGATWVPSDSSTTMTLTPLPEPGMMAMMAAAIGLVSRRKSRGK